MSIAISYTVTLFIIMTLLGESDLLLGVTVSSLTYLLVILGLNMIFKPIERKTTLDQDAEPTTMIERGATPDGHTVPWETLWQSQDVPNP